MRLHAPAGQQELVPYLGLWPGRQKPSYADLIKHELKQPQHGIVDMALSRSKSASFQVSLKGKAPPLIVAVETIDIEKVSAIDILSQQFAAAVFVKLRVDGGALDKDLSREDEEVRTDDDGSLHPSARWYLGKLEAKNAAEYAIENAAVLHENDDLILQAKITGTFCEPKPCSTSMCSLVGFILG